MTHKKRRVFLIFTSCLIFLLAIDNSLLFPQRVSAAASLAGYWKFDEGSGTTAADSSGNGHTATLEGNATWGSGQIGSYALQLNGTPGTYADISGPVINTTQSFTVAAWVNLTSTNGYQTFVSIDGSQVSGFYFQLRGDSGKFALTRLAGDSTSSATVVASALSAPTTNTWYYLVGVYDASAQTISLYVDGALQQTVSFTSPWQATGDTVIGRGKYSGSPVDFVSGRIDDVRIYNGALSSQSVQALQANGYWSFDEGSGTTAADSSPFNTPGTIHNATWTTGEVGRALAFNGISSYVDMGNHASLNFGTGSFSITSWFKTSARSGQQRIDSKGYDGWSNGYFLGLGANSAARTGSIGGGIGGGTQASSLLFSSTTSFNDGKWHLAALVIDRSTNTAQIYVDGIAQSVVTQPGTCGIASGTTVNIANCGSLNATTMDDFTVGSYNGAADFFNGSINEVGVYQYVLTASFLAQQSNVALFNIQANQSGASISPTLYGLMFEEINHSGDGGIYGELIQNRIFQDNPTTPVHWSTVASSGASGSIALDTTQPVNTTALTTSLKLQIANVGAGQRVGVANDGYWGIPVKPHTTYRASFYAKASADFSGPLTVDLEDNSGSPVYAIATVPSISTSWKQYYVTLTTPGNITASETNHFVISASHSGTVWFNLVSLFPPTWNNRPNGMRTDLMQLLNNMHPSFLRFPGGNYLEGATFDTRFQWENTIGPLSQRPGHEDTAWGYRSSDGLGLLEYLEWCEDLHMTPVLAVYAGYSLNGTHVSVGTPQFTDLVNSALNEIQYATGSINTPWGAQRAADGHPAPFHIQYVEIGNEDFFDSSGSYNQRFAAFYDAIKAAYPQIKLIATTTVTSRTPDVYDQHFYESPGWFEGNSNYYDNYSRSAPRIFVGEYATQEGKPTPDLNAALGDAAWMTGLERNSDVVIMASYAPLFVNVNDPNWGTNLIGYDALNSYGSPSYYVQKLFSLYHGNVVIPTQLTGNPDISYVVSKATSDGTLYIKVVNALSTAQTAHFTLNGIRHVFPLGAATVLTSAHGTDTNTLSNPDAVVPVTHQLHDLGTTFTYTLAPNSVTVLQLHV
jgi:alpha-L-arabinofuranosidase